jgi:Glycosyltransferase family 10 (fucosyltransferase) C-term
LRPSVDITEKLWDTLRSGTLPVYMGAPNVREHAPFNSIISWHDFPSTEALGSYLIQVANNRTLYESYHTWRTQPLPSAFQKKYDFTHVHSICRICRWAHARRYGYTFDHDTQAIRTPIIDRRPCWDSTTQLVSYPIRELWWQESAILLAASDNVETCDRNNEDHRHTKSIGTWARTLRTTDGVLDIAIEGTGEHGMYQLGLAVHGSAVEVTKQQWRIENGQSRLTLLTNWDAKLRLDALSQGVADIEMRGLKSMKIRIILEDIDYFYSNSSSDPTYFNDLMIKDFQQSIEQFLISNS